MSKILLILGRDVLGYEFEYKYLSEALEKFVTISFTKDERGYFQSIR